MLQKVNESYRKLGFQFIIFVKIYLKLTKCRKSEINVSKQFSHIYHKIICLRNNETKFYESGIFLASWDNNIIS